MNEHLVNEDGTVAGVFFGRTKKHTRGLDIEIFHPNNELFFNSVIGVIQEADVDYFIEYIKPIKEYRIHVMGDDVILAQKKYFGEELYARLIAEVPEGERNYFASRAEYVRNNETGWRFYDIQDMTKVPQAVMDAAKASIGCLGLHFGAVDVIWGGQKKGPFVLEVNTAPGLRERNLLLYADNIINKYIVEG